MAENLFTWMIDRADNLCYRPTILIHWYALGASIERDIQGIL